MDMKQEFLDYLRALQAATPKEIAEGLMTDNVKQYISLLEEKNEKPVLTEGGVKILTYLQSNPDIGVFKSSDIASALVMNSRAVAGSLRKLVEDGFCEKVSQNPTVYNLTEKGKNYTI